MINIIKDYISTIDIPIGVSKRLDCPICTGNKTLSVTNFGNCIKYYCFHSSCSKGGVIEEGLNETSFSKPEEIKKDVYGLEIFKQHWRTNNCPSSFYEYIKNSVKYQLFLHYKFHQQLLHLMMHF